MCIRNVFFNKSTRLPHFEVFDREDRVELFAPSSSGSGVTEQRESVLRDHGWRCDGDTWVEWDDFLGGVIVQATTDFAFARLTTEHDV